MYKCPECGCENREGVFFCERCGFTIGTTPVLTSVLSDNLRKSTAFPSKISHVGSTGEVTMYVHGNAKPMTLRVENEIVLGRAGNGTSRLHDFVDLDKFRASELGVSRRHAVICRQDDELYIRDLNSTNHTFVNGMRVPEDRDFLLQAGDEIALGKLILKVYFR